VLAAKRLLLRMSGPGNARIDGTVDTVSAQLSGSGSLDGHGLTAGHADVAVRGAGGAVVNVNGRTETKSAAPARANRARVMTVDRSGTRVAGELNPAATPQPL
jgi:hypothetical protein